MHRGRRLNGSSQRGAGLIEVSVSLLVLAIGVLGLGGLQISSKRMGYEAIQRGEAAALAMDLLERVRINRAELAAYSTEGLGQGSGVQSTEPEADCGAGACSPVQLNTWDLWQWQQALDGEPIEGGAGGLVRPTACVAVSGRQITVEIAWQGYRPLSAPVEQGDCGLGRYGADDADRQWLQMVSWIGAE